MKNIVGDHQFIIERREMMVHFQDMYHKPEESEMISSPSGKYSLEIHYYYHEEGNRLYSYSKGIIKDNSNNVIDIIYRNYGHFPYQWAETGEEDYLLCGLDYQGYSVINLSQRITTHYVPEEAYEGQGFCWLDIYFLREEKLLAVDGCYWGCPYELVIFDFSNPMKLPYTEIFRMEIDEITNWDTWNTEEKNKYIREQVKSLRVDL